MYTKGLSFMLLRIGCMQVGEFMRITTNRNLVICVISLVFAIACISIWALQNQYHENQTDREESSKLDTLLSLARSSLYAQNITVLSNPNNVTIIVPNVTANTDGSGKISSVGPGPIIVK